MILDAGRLRHRIAILRATEVEDGRGGYTTSWAVIATPYAEVIGINGREAVIANALAGVSYYRITIRWRDGIQPSDQIRYGAIDLNIRSVSDPYGMREQLLILADTDGARKTA